MTATAAFRRRPPAQPQRGLTMIELMISITIGLFLVGAIGYLYISSRGAYRSNAALSRLQEGGRLGIDAIMHDARSVGDLGCNAAATVNGSGALALPGDAGISRVFAGPDTELFGVEAADYQMSNASSTTFTLPAGAKNPPSWVAGDVVQMIIPTSRPAALTADVAGSTVSLAENKESLRAGDVLLLANCVNAGLATVTADTGGALTVTINADPLPASVVPRLTTATHATAQRVDAVTYFVGKYPNRAPALYRYSQTYMVAEEVVDHVENMSVMYGVGSQPPVRASVITAAGNWGKVTSIRVALQVAGEEQSTAAAGTPITLVPGGTVAGSTANPADTRLRQIFTATAALRNRLP